MEQESLFDSPCATCFGSKKVFDPELGEYRPCPRCSPVRDIPHARMDDLATSKRSAALTEAEEGTTSIIRQGTLKHLALVTIADYGPMTANEAERQCGRRGIWKRVSDLKNAGLIEAEGERHDPVTNRQVTAWVPTSLGYAVRRALEIEREVRL